MLGTFVGVLCNVFATGIASVCARYVHMLCVAWYAVCWMDFG